MKKTPEELRTSLVARFWARVEVGNPEECWEWQGQLRNGYGVLGYGHSGKVYAHRLAVELSGRELIDGTDHVCHHCDNPKCCNPGHLFIGTNADNARDARDKSLRVKGRCRRGHLKTPENTIERVDSNGYLHRYCIACDKIQHGVVNPRGPGQMTSTHCRNGHVLAEVGVYLHGGRRRCRACVLKSNRASAAR